MSHPETILLADAMLTPAGPVAPAELAFDAAGRITYAGAPRATSLAAAGSGSAPAEATAPEAPASPETQADAEAQATAATPVVHQLAGHVLMPGLVNGHTHSAMTLLRGVSDDEGFMPWLAAVQGLEQHLTHDDVAVGLQLAMIEMIETGTVAFADMYHWDERLIELVRGAGMRAMVALASFTPEAVGFPGVSPWNGADTVTQTEQLAERYAGDPQIRVAYGPHAPYTCPPEFLRDIGERAKRLGIPVHTHISESAAEVAQITEQYGATPAAHLASLGLFDAEVLAAHCVHITDDEIAEFASHGVAVSHNPVSNLKLGCGVARLPEWQQAGLRISLGTDSVASNNSLDLFEEIKLAATLHRGVRGDAAIVRAADVLGIATSGGAEALGFAGSGSLAVGALADVIALDVSGSAATPLDLAGADAAALTSHLGFAATGHDVRHVFVGGRHLYANGEHLTLDALAIRVRARAARARLREAAAAADPAAADPAAE
ncbi:5-methylthioadenosine/S-adenosylhomocysteine deaminase [Leucobacter exalbidus]|uniref:5-methylthioadenosine/S-adenosylhomocysteine deaminase n=1 Tax=Leucobacter exalbidus TaxID=662960 RepID=A0A940PMV0_9MICO|nr:amidohydrolase [Leucobacter exalbidus]MBP1326063.1 5-methylthioadenosine/S-adenosylhomocysteine deaminase [Leucobacter exalbidus]